MMPMRIAIIMPILNEAPRLTRQLDALQRFRIECQVIIVDGGSHDGSIALAESKSDHVLHSSRGRAKQMNTGAAYADADLMIFLHADTVLPDNAIEPIVQAVADGHQWGRFDVKLDSPQLIFKLIACMMNLRSRLTHISTGDQAIFITRDAFTRVGGYPEIALMEDIAISSQLKKLGKPACLGAKVITSARRWQQQGVIKTILLMWLLRLRYFLGADPDRLVKQYYRSS